MNVLYPGIRLLDRLRLGMKFGLISLFIFIPILLTNYLLLGERLEDEVAIRNELSALTPLQQGLNLLNDLQELHDLTLLQNMQASDELQRRVDQLYQQLMQSLGTLQADWQDRATAAQFRRLRDDLNDSLKGLMQQAFGTRQGLLKEALSKAPGLLELAASGSGLAQNRSMEVRQVVSLLTQYSPKVRWLIGQSRAIGAQALGLKLLQASASGNLDNLTVELETLQQDYQIQLQNAALAHDLQRLFQASLQSLDDSRALLEQQVLLADELNTPWQDFFDELSAQLQQSVRFEQSALEMLRGHLQQELEHSHLRMRIQVAGMVVGLLLIIYLYSAFYASLRGTLQGLARTLDRVAEGDLTAHYQADSHDELSELGQVFNGSVQRIRGVIGEIRRAVDQVDDQSRQMESVASLSNAAMADQRRMIEQVATAMTQMTTTAQEVARSALTAADGAQQVNNETAQGRSLVDMQVINIQQLAGEIAASATVINQLANDSAAIGQVLEVIKGIAEQTNLLALNAAIEAARAGEQGRGFAVVADEVRSLSKRTQQSTGEIEQMITRLQNGGSAAVKAMDSSHSMASGNVSESVQVQQNLENILSSIGLIADQSQQISASAEEQTAVALEIDQHILQISVAAEQTAEGANMAEQASRKLGQLVGELNGLIETFRV